MTDGEHYTAGLFPAMGPFVAQLPDGRAVSIDPDGVIRLWSVTA